MASWLAGRVEAAGKTARHAAQLALRAVRAARWALAAPSVERPVFVVGCSRAGTTLVYKTLSLARGLGTLNRETHAFWEALHPLAARGWHTHALTAADARPADRAAVARLFYTHTGRRRFVDKNNQNGLAVPYLQALFADAHFVFIRRNPGDNILSLMRGWERPGEYGTWSEGLPAEVRIDGGRIRRWCFFLPEGWRAHLEDSLPEVCAWQYAAINRAILDARAQVPPAQWHELAYEEVLADPVATFRRLFAGLELAFDRRMEAHCRGLTDRPYNAFSPVGTDKWRAHARAEAIAAAMGSIGPTIRALGYAAADTRAPDRNTDPCATSR